VYSSRYNYQRVQAPISTVLNGGGDAEDIRNDVYGLEKGCFDLTRPLPGDGDIEIEAHDTFSNRQYMPFP